MTKDEITAWALANGWQMIDGAPSLTKPAKPHPAIVRLVLKATVASVEIKKPAGKWEKVSGESYSKIEADPETGMPYEYRVQSDSVYQLCAAFATANSADPQFVTGIWRHGKGRTCFSVDARRRQQ